MYVLVLFETEWIHRFILFLNLLVLIASKIFISLYGDDAVLISNSMEDLQSLLFRMKEVCMKNGLMVNVRWSSVMVFERIRNRRMSLFIFEAC